MRERQTRQLMAVRQVIEDQARPLSPGEVYSYAKETIPSIGVASVYRILNHFTEEGWIVSHEIPGGGTRFERADLPHHHHFHCNQCDKVFDVKGCVGNLSKLLPNGFSLEEHNITLRGRCSSCQ